MIIESPPLYRNVSALVNLQIRIASMGLSIEDAQVRAILNRVGIADRADDKVGAFSVGIIALFAAIVIGVWMPTLESSSSASSPSPAC